MTSRGEMMSKYAYVVIFYGGDATFLEALVLGRSLRESGSKQDRLILCRRGIPKWQLDHLSTYFTVLSIDPFPISENAFTPETLTRFNGVFDKLYAWSLEQYEKVVLLDADMLAFGNPDDIFKFETPAACFRGPPYAWEHRPVTASDIERGIKKNPGYLNIGTVLLEPSLREMNNLEQALLRHAAAGDSFLYPEQDFLREYYKEQWNSLPAYFNWCASEYGWGIPRRLWRRSGADLRVEDHVIFHFLWVYKPLQFLAHRDWIRDLLSESGSSPAAVRIISMLNEGKRLPRFGETNGCRLAGMLQEWFIHMEEVLDEVGLSLDQLSIAPYLTSEETLRFKEQTKMQREETRARERAIAQSNKRPINAVRLKIPGSGSSSLRLGSRP